MTHFKGPKLLSIALIAITLSLLLSGVSPVQAASVRDPVLKVRLATTTLTTLTDAGIVRLSSVVGGLSYNNFDIVVKVDSAVLDPTRITIGSALVSPHVYIYCLNGVGIGCNLNDGPGIAHLAAYSSINGVNGTLFKIAYKPINGIGSFGTVGTTVTIPCFNVLENKTPIPPAKFSVITATYGTVPAAAQPTATIASNQTSITIKSGSSHDVTITVTPINGFSNLVTLTASTVGVLTARFGPTATTTTVSCDCGAAPALQLTIHPSAAGSFSVQVTEKIHSTIITTITISVTAN